MKSATRLFVSSMVLFAAFVLPVIADDLKPIAPIPRLLPPKGVDIGKEERARLEARLPVNDPIAKLRDRGLRDVDKDLLVDVEIYYKAVRWALDFDEFYDVKKDIAKAHALLDAAEDRIHCLLIHNPVWTKQRGLVVRGYRSDIDDSVQPYGLHIPENLDLSKPVPLLVWLHGRGDKVTDMHFIDQRQKSKGEFAPDWCITLHPYGRGTIGWKFAGEIDVMDAIESVKKRYKIDEDRIALAGFSMGGAGAWHIGAHYADRFCVVHAGAGFVETAEYNHLKPEDYPEWYVQKLWGWYDVPDYTRNLFNVPVIAYSGEIDKQKQAADMMAKAFKAEGRELNHIIGPGAAHKYEAKAKAEVLKQIKAAVEKGREKWPKEVHLQTRSLRYGKMYWVELLRFEKPWEEARIDAEFVAPNRIEVVTKNVARFNLLWPRRSQTGSALPLEIVIDGKKAKSDTGFIKFASGWETDGYFDGDDRPFGPIDDAFFSRFMMVLPSGVADDAKVQRWTEFESVHVATRWRALFRGDPLVTRDRDFNSAVPFNGNLVLWGTPTTNRLIKQVADKLPIRWGHDTITIGGQTFSAADHVPVFICRTSLATGYTVINSGPTFREGHDRTNSQQTPKLPDWAIIGLDKDPDAYAPGEIKAAGFFDENWKVKQEKK